MDDSVLPRLDQFRSYLHVLARVQNLQTALDGPNPHHRQLSTEAALLASQAARLMINETLDWRIVLLDRPLELHA